MDQLDSEIAYSLEALIHLEVLLKAYRDIKLRNGPEESLTALCVELEEKRLPELLRGTVAVLFLAQKRAGRLPRKRQMGDDKPPVD